MRYSAILLFFVIVSCSKKMDTIVPAPAPHAETIETCSFGIAEFNMIKRPAVNLDVFKGKPGTGETAASSNVIYLDFDGQLVSGTTWNVSGPINCAPAALTATEIAEITERVTVDFAPFNLTITTDEAVYNNANIYKRMRVVVTDSWEWFGQAGGVSYINSFTWGNNSPCFVFSSLLGYNTKKIAEACSHEAGHTLGLRHQSLYDAAGVKIAEYNPGAGSGETGWAPIMGVSYHHNVTLWHNGPNAISAGTIQNDVAIIGNVTGYKTDDFSNSTTGAASFNSSINGMINSSADIDFFSINLNTAKTISLLPKNVGAGNEAANLDLVLKIYSNQGVLLSTIGNPEVLHATSSLAKGSYLVSVSTSDNQYTTRYGMLSRYSLTLN
jgi:hypothetical protein